MLEARELKKFGRSLLRTLPEGRSFLLERWMTTPQPREAKAIIVFSVLTEAGPGASGKVSALEYLPAFCAVLRKKGYATQFVSSLREMRRVLRRPVPTILVHLFGEDHSSISGDEIRDLEGMSAATFNKAETGDLLADKVESHKAFAQAGVPVPALRNSGGFTRSRFGTGQPTQTDDAAASDDAHRISTEFIDSRVEFRGREFYTTVRLLCLDDIILHTYPRARDVRNGEASVQTKYMPVDPDLVEHLDRVLVQPYTARYAKIAATLFDLLGHGFYAHDLLVENTAGSIFVCESGFKFDAKGYSTHLEPIHAQVPSQHPLFPAHAFAEQSADAFSTRCKSILNAQSKE